MLKRFPVAAALLIVIIACTDEKSTAGGVVDPNTVAKSLTEEDVAYMDSLLNSFGDVGSGFEDAYETGSIVSSGSSLELAPTIFLFDSKKESVYSKLGPNSTGSCYVNIYREENGAEFSKSNGIDVYGENAFLIKDKEGTLYLQELYFGLYGSKNELCKLDSVKFISSCKEIGGMYKIYNKGCSKESSILEMSCVSKNTSETLLDSIALTLTDECEKFANEFLEVELPLGETGQASYKTDSIQCSIL